MESAINNGMCRCCASEGTFKDLKSAYQWMGDEEVYSEMLRECFDITLFTNIEGEVEGGICEVCVTQLRNASNFKKQVLQTEEQFKLRLQDKLFKNDIVKVEAQPDSDNDSDNDHASEDYSEYEVPIKLESDEPKPKKRGAKASTSRAKRTKTDDGETSKRIPHINVKSESKESKSDDEGWTVRIVNTEPEKIFEQSSMKPKIKKINKFPVKLHAQRDDLKKIAMKINQFGPIKIFFRDNNIITKGRDKIKFSKPDKNPASTSEETDLLSLNVEPPNSHGGTLEQHRQNIQEILLYSNATPINRGGLSYSCCFCLERYTTPQDLKKHNLDSHTDEDKKYFMETRLMSTFIVKLDITSLQCKPCGIPIDVLEDLMQHLYKVHKRPIHFDIKNHIIPYKFVDDTIRCVICQNIYHSFKKLQEHMHSHYSNYACNYCEAGFVNQAMLAAHIRTHKESMSPAIFKCELCPKAFPTSLRKKAHIRDVHVQSMRNIKCAYCGEKFETYNARFKHLADVHGVKFTKCYCQACDRVFPRKSALTTHIKRSHLMERPHPCSDCDKSFFSRKELENHMVKHSSAKEFKCNECHKTFARWKTLREHLRIHLNERRFKCDHCHQTFVQKCSLKGHLRSKHGDEMLPSTSRAVSSNASTT